MAKKKDENAVYVGRRPTMNYVMATMMILNRGDVCTVNQVSVREPAQKHEAGPFLMPSMYVKYYEIDS